MNLRKFDELASYKVDFRNLLAQDMTEWKFYMEIISAYFENRGVKRPIVVEIGLMHNAQKRFYAEMLDAEHIGIDMNYNSEPDILADSQKPGTIEELKVKLKGQMIDLLFIDGNHSYESVKLDFEIYAPLTKHIIAIHDISATVNSQVMRYWKELKYDDRYLTVDLNHFNGRPDKERGIFKDMGIGLIIKDVK